MFTVITYPMHSSSTYRNRKYTSAHKQSGSDQNFGFYAHQIFTDENLWLPLTIVQHFDWHFDTAYFKS
jgi:hypothetical protein